MVSFTPVITIVSAKKRALSMGKKTIVKAKWALEKKININDTKLIQSALAILSVYHNTRSPRGAVVIISILLFLSDMRADWCRLITLMLTS